MEPLELTLEQKRALALARARLRLKQSAPQAEPQPEPLTPQNFPAPPEVPYELGQKPITPEQQSNREAAMRQLGLGARALVRGATAVPTMMADAAAVPLRAMTGGKYFQSPSAVLDRTMTDVGLPEPQNQPERLAQDVIGTMAGTGAIGKGAEFLGKGASAAAKPYLDMLASNQGGQLVSSAAAGGAGGLARESGAGPMGQFGASMAGGMAIPAAVGAGRFIGNKMGDAGATVGASFGNKRAIKRIAKDAAVRVAGDSRERQLAALLRGTEYAPGVKPTAPEAIAEANMGLPEQFGGATIKLGKDLSGARGIEDIIPSAVRKQNVAMAEHLKNVKAQTKPMREAALGLANVKGVASDNVISKIDKSLSVPGQRASDVVQKTLGAVKEKIASLADDSGRINAEDLYTVRKEIGNTIQRFSKETANWDKKLSGSLEREIQGYIDDAIESSGGKGWKEYLSTYSSGMKAAENQLARQREAKIIAAGVKSSHGASLTAGEIPKPPTLLSRPMMAVNYVLRMLSRDANTPVAKYMANKMTDSKAYAELLREGNRAADPDAARRAALAAALYQGQ